jgi:DNA modification methylase
MRKYVEKETVDLCYIDPPFNSERSYFQIYNRKQGEEDHALAQASIDTWKWDAQASEGFREIILNERYLCPPQTIELIKGLRAVLKEGSLLAYLVSMTRRIPEIHRILKPTGSFYLHCDPTSSHYLKLVADGIFCSQGGDFKNEVIWNRTHAHGGANKWGDVHDVILFYTKSEKFTWNQALQDHDDEYLRNKYRFKDERGRYRLVVLTGPGTTKGASASISITWSIQSILPHRNRISRLTILTMRTTVNAHLKT